MPYNVKGEQRNTGRTHFKKGQVPWNKKPDVFITCEMCGIKKKVKPACKDANRFCSRKCYWESLKEVKGVKHHRWKGEDIDYTTLHSWIKKYKEKPSKCEICGEDRRLELANKDHTYKRIVDDYMYICRSCHRFWDIKHNGYAERHKGMFKKLN